MVIPLTADTERLTTDAVALWRDTEGGEVDVATLSIDSDMLPGHGIVRDVEFPIRGPQQ